MIRSAARDLSNLIAAVCAASGRAPHGDFEVMRRALDQFALLEHPLMDAPTAPTALPQPQAEPKQRPAAKPAALPAKRRR